MPKRKKSGSNPLSGFNLGRLMNTIGACLENRGVRNPWKLGMYGVVAAIYKLRGDPVWKVEKLTCKADAWEVMIDFVRNMPDGDALLVSAMGKSTKQSADEKLQSLKSLNTEEIDFHASKQWRAVRYQALKRSDGACECCGMSKADGTVLHVDHIKPRSKFPDLALVLENLQVLCADCNHGKGAWDQTDWRSPRLVVNNVA